MRGVAVSSAGNLTPEQRRAISGPVANLLDQMQEEGGPLDSSDAFRYAARSTFAMAAGLVFAQLGVEVDEDEMALLNEWAYRAIDQVELLALARGQARLGEVETLGEIAEPEVPPC